ncbi:polyprenyl synthetase family protein [Candidatus Pacearchaeota archaeon]|nr:polyprenyl synthetase family protein [Candidatus Pacearchaeota archaeon]
MLSRELPLLERHINFENEQLHVLTALYGAVVGAVSEADIELCKSIELMKSSTLILDDFLDESPKRNGIASIYAEQGAKTAVLTAELLKGVASSKLIEILRTDARNYDKLAFLHVFEDTYATICRGQMRDISLAKIPILEYVPSEKDYFDLIGDTSACYIRAPLLMGGIVMNLPKDVLTSLGDFGINIGLAYQIRDDVLDLVGDPENMGKPFAGDIREKKKRLPLIHHLSVEPRGLVRKIMTKPCLNDEDVIKVVEELRRTRSLQYCVDKIFYFKEEAMDSLSYKNNELAAIAELITNFQGGI